MLEQLGRLADAQGIQAYAVGGCVRDWLLNRTNPTDLDIAVVGDGIAFARHVGAVFGVTVKSHEPFGTATLDMRRSLIRSSAHRAQGPRGTLRIDIATCRKERYAKPAAYPTVTAGTLKNDLFRRDFTVNAMAVAINRARFGALIDPFNGRRDLRARRLRILHPNSFIDDPSRILRAVRFTRRFGLTVERHTARQLRQAMADGMLTLLNRGRLRKERERMAQEPNPGACRVTLERWLRGRV